MILGSGPRCWLHGRADAAGQPGPVADRDESAAGHWRPGLRARCPRSVLSPSSWQRHPSPWRTCSARTPD